MYVSSVCTGSVLQHGVNMTTTVRRDAHRSKHALHADRCGPRERERERVKSQVKSSQSVKGKRLLLFVVGDLIIIAAIPIYRI